MSTSGISHSPGGFVQPPGNTSVDLGSGGRAYSSGDSSDLSVNDPARRTERYDTPPASFVEAVSPTSSRKGGKLRAGSLGISPSAGRVNGPPLSNGLIGPRKLFPQLDISDPTLTWEAPMNRIIRQPLPRVSVPPIGNNLRHLMRNVSDDNTQVSNNQLTFTIPPPASILRSEPYRDAESAETGQSLGESIEPHKGNPYIRRADEIGHSHRIPGLSHLGGLLVPPGWKERDEPINPQEAKALYDTARSEARVRDAHEKSMEGTINMSVDAREACDQEREKRWDTQLQLDHMVLEERIKIYEQNAERNRMRVKGTGLGQLGLSKSVAFSPLFPLHPPTSTSFPVYTGPARTDDTLVHPSRNVDVRGEQVGQQGDQHFPQHRTDSISPGCLEPSLITNSFQSIFARYQATQADLLHRRDENERMLSSFLERYGRHFSTGPLPVSPTKCPQPTSSEAPPLAGIQTGSSPAGQAHHPSWGTIRPPPYESPTQATFMNINNVFPMKLLSGRSGHVGAAGQDWTWDNNGVAIPRDPGQGLLNEEPNNKQGQTNVESPSESAGQISHTQNDGVPKPKKQATSRAKVEKKKTWYHDQMVKANMPTSAITEEALEAGRRYGNQGVGTKKSAVQKPSTPKKAKPQGIRRGRKPDFDPLKGFALSNQAADRLIAGGFVKERVAIGATVPPFSASLVANPGTISTGVPVSKHSLYVPGPGTRPDQVSNLKEIRNAAASLQALGRDNGTWGNAPAYTEGPRGTVHLVEQKDVASEQDDDDTEEDSGSRDNDDPNDASFGSRSTGRKKVKPQKSAGPATKRKSAASATPAKRSRPNVDGGLDGGLDGAADVRYGAPQDAPSW